MGIAQISYSGRLVVKKHYCGLFAGIELSGKEAWTREDDG